MSLIIKAYAEGWVTINGVHVYISNLGKIKKGPAKFIGSTLDDLKGSNKSTADKKAELQKKYSKKSEGKTSTGSSAYDRSLTDDLMGSVHRDMNHYKMWKEEPPQKQAQKTTDEVKAESMRKHGDKLAEKKKSSEIKSKGDSKESSNESKLSSEEKHRIDEGLKKGKSALEKGITRGRNPSSEPKKGEPKTKEESPKTKAETKTPVTKKEGVETFKVDGVEYQFKINSKGEGVITKDNGTTLVGFNSSYKSVNDAIKSVKSTNESVARSNAAEQIAAKTGGVALYTGKVIMPGSVKQAGVDKDGFVQYTATDHTGKTIKLDSSDMGAVMVAGIDMRNAKAMNNLSKNISKSSSPASSNTGNATFDRVIAESHGDNFGGGASSKSTGSTGKPKTMADYYRSLKRGYTIGNSGRGKTPATQNSAKSSNPATVSKGNPSLGVTHYDGFGKGSRNEYKAIYPDGTSKRISAKQAKQMFPDDPFFKKK